MKREIIITSDGSTTIHLPDWNEQYHSKHGAIQEAYHVFIRNGLEALPIANISILEIGFGTGLNCFITFLEAQKKAISINYTGVEGYPIQKEELEKLNYVTALSAGSQSAIFDKMHEVLWNEEQEITKEFSLLKKQQFFEDIDEENAYDLVYFDAFGATNQPELWTEVIFEKMYKAMKKGGILVTYSAKGSVRRAMQAVGFVVERLPGPPGKREMLRAVKTII
ncbi:tRNA (5-methylaminomethyl-2-thiouridine)(34)-methyltransferase MnmD [Tenacibaculum maritimum]|uniref:tRNA (5-methylaminomethyl-2-thiouridine)(34)-methyltransferase MnmD n=1 Tax=Tenacibaculum maritimum TaxID=107401 RepID=UPI001330589A|nr:tRNA (5-methylaminomethyl-2-thiouridine)(34)-methyltransferase MnmD [Tenacibaculum maritimum]MCD9582960.1 tRNA (5-methylaminomethyl-2-thiouridine)(34)-methyltransferase MnmD [Tenacibaculum maritimum]MCD9637173.1 tRNA (5-methylaminomethyl-2-thiouridine)(34)-methyltransferase MnmD [Tenacibaculum maritimum]